MDLMEKVVSLAKRRGFVYPGSEIYGGMANTYDYGPLGTELRRNLKNLWWERFVKSRPNMYGLDGGILLNPAIWKASGHVESFTDPLVECKKCNKRFRLDQMEEFENEGEYFESKVWPVPCPSGGHSLDTKWIGEQIDGHAKVAPRVFNGMFRTFVGATEDSDSVVYLRPETAQAIFVNFNNILNSFSPKLPFGIAQIGKAFRNEITAGYYIFRMLEFEQMEIEYFIKPDMWEQSFNQWESEIKEWLKLIGIREEKVRFREHDEKERSHYSKKTVDLEYEYPIGFKELYGLAYRGDYDLTNHAKHSGRDINYVDSQTGEKFVPHVIEPSFGVDRTILAVLLEAYSEEEDRVVLKLAPRIAPFTVAVFPLVKNKPEIVDKAKSVFNSLVTDFSVAWDDRGNIGKRYFSQDEIGTPWCLTIDYQTLEDDTVTVRDRDSKEQSRIAIAEIESYIRSKI